MSFLNDLTEDQRVNLVSLPYRVGFWVSNSDSSGGYEADEQELQALTNILKGFAHEVFSSETVQHVISGTIEHKEEWPRWSKNIDHIADDCRRAVDVLSGVVDVKEVNAFKQHLIEIGEAVAIAFREEEQTGLARLKTYVEFYKGKVRASKMGRSYKSFEQFLNISREERKALNTLAQALDMIYV